MAAQLGAPRPALGEGLGAAFEQGFQGTTLGSWDARAAETRGAMDDPTPLSREEWQASGLARPKLQWDEGMTRGRAEAMARTFDERQRIARVQAARDPGAFETALQFGAMLGGSLFDPANLLPFAPAVSLGLRAGGGVAGGLAGRALTSAAERFAAPTLGGYVARGVVDATLGNLAVAPLVYSTDARYGEDITFGTVMRDLSIGAIIGAGFGAAGRALAGAVDAPTAVRTLDAAASDVAAGRPMAILSDLATRAVEDAVMRSAPPELAGLRLADLPIGPDGLPVSRAEFAALAARAERSRPATLSDLDARDAQEARGGAPAASVMELLQAIRRGEDRPRGEKSLTQFVVEQGGIRDERGDVRNMMGAGSRTRPGLLNNARGLPVDEMAEKARAAGYFPEFGGREASPDRAVGEDGFGMRAFIEALDEDLNKSRVRLGDTEDVRARELSNAAGDLDSLLEINGASLAESDARILEVLRGLREDAPARSLDDLLRDEADYAWYREAVAAKQHVARMAAAPPVEADMGGAGLGENPQRAAASAADRAGEGSGSSGPEAAQIEAMRAEGRLSPEDEALLRAGDDAAAEMEGAARGLTEAGECLLRNLA